MLPFSQISLLSESGIMYNITLFEYRAGIFQSGRMELWTNALRPSRIHASVHFSNNVEGLLLFRTMFVRYTARDGSKYEISSNISDALW